MILCDLPSQVKQSIAMNSKGRVLSSMLLVSFSLATLSSLAEEPAKIAPTPIKIQNVKNRQFNQDMQEVGKITAVDSTALTFSASEILQNKYFKDGAYVKKGEVIAALDNTQAKAELRKSQTQYKIEQSKLQRMLALVKKQPDSISKQDLENQQLQTHLAKVDEQQKQDSLSNYELIAPFNGQLTNFKYSIGSRVRDSDIIVSIIKNDPVEVDYSISQEELADAKVGQKVTITVDAYKNKSFTGDVNYIAPLVDQSSGRIDVHAEVENSDKLLVPGMFAKVTERSHDSHTFPIVPQTVIVVDGDQRYVWLYDGKGVTKQAVTLGENTNDGFVAITKGLKIGDHVVVSGQQNLNTNSIVEVENQDKSKLTAQPQPQPQPQPTKDKATLKSSPAKQVKWDATNETA